MNAFKPMYDFQTELKLRTRNLQRRRGDWPPNWGPRVRSPRSDAHQANNDYGVSLGKDNLGGLEKEKRNKRFFQELARVLSIGMSLLGPTGAVHCEFQVGAGQQGEVSRWSLSLWPLLFLSVPHHGCSQRAWHLKFKDIIRSRVKNRTYCMIPLV